MKICCVFNFGALYRAPIYQLIDTCFDADFFIGDETGGESLKKMNYQSLKGLKGTLLNVRFGPFIWRKGYKSACKNEYQTFIMTGEPNCITDWFILIWARLHSKRVLIWGHGWYGSESMFARFVKKTQYRLCSGLLLYGKRASHLLLKEGIRENKIFVIYNSLDYTKQLEIRMSLKPSSLYKRHFANDNKNIVFIGRLIKDKKFSLLLEAVSILNSRNQYCNVTFIGDGEEREWMERRIEELELTERVWFYGSCYDEQTNANLIFNADLCVSPGKIGLTAVHVLMFGCPAITCDDFTVPAPEFEAICEGKTGSFFKSDDPISLADTISKWFRNHQNKREIVRQACYREIDSKWNPNYQLEILKKAITV